MKPEENLKSFQLIMRRAVQINFALKIARERLVKIGSNKPTPYFKREAAQAKQRVATIEQNLKQTLKSIKYQ